MFVLHIFWANAILLKCFRFKKKLVFWVCVNTPMYFLTQNIQAFLHLQVYSFLISNVYNPLK